MKPNTPQWMLRRFATRALAIHARLAPEDLAIEAYEHTLIPSAHRFIELFERGHARAPRNKTEYQEGKAAIAALLKRLRVWTSIVSTNIEKFDASEYGDRPDVPDDVISDTQNLIGLVAGHQDQLPYADKLIADLTAALDTATKEWREADNATVDRSTLRADARKAARAFERDLVSFRTTLKTIFGSSHPDYQKLRRRRAKTRDEDDDEATLGLLDDVEGEEGDEGEQGEDREA